MASRIFKSRVVPIGDIPLGGDHPVRLQSMTSSNTMDTRATVDQSIRMIMAGCEYVRITAPGVKEAENLRIIKKEIRDRGFNTPIIADIHYQPQAALVAARHVEKVRINPGNYIDRKRGKLHYTEAEYHTEMERIRERLKPLVETCMDFGTALRIGSNHGSLSERILLRYGDTPRGMVESALEFVSICRSLNFHNLVLSMKASNVKIMVQANRLLVSRMLDLGMDYPIHLGVTEAGDAEDGRMKSAAGIGPLLLDGIGDTIRVSLTEDPEFEIPVAKEIATYSATPKRTHDDFGSYTVPFDPFSYSRRNSTAIEMTGGSSPPVVVSGPTDLAMGGLDFKSGFEADLIIDHNQQILKRLIRSSQYVPIGKPLIVRSSRELKETIPRLNPENILVFKPPYEILISSLRAWFQLLTDNEQLNPVILYKDYGDIPPDSLLIKASIDFSYFLTDGLLDGVWINSSQLSPAQMAVTSYGILQATGERISKTEYIACPSCGRTLFNIQSTLQVIKERTSHLKGLKIGVMGCCVNGPGEMADAHYGYVGAGKGKITLYKGKQIMKTGISEELAVDELIKLIKENGDWE